MKKFLLAAAVLAIILVAGCTGQPQTNANSTVGNETNQTLYLPPSGQPTIKIISPTSNEVIKSSAVGIKVNVTNFRLADTTAHPVNAANEGHIVYWLDNKYQTTVYQIVSFTGVAAGTHIIRVELMNNDNSPFVPEIFATVVVTTV